MSMEKKFVLILLIFVATFGAQTAIAATFASTQSSGDSDRNARQATDKLNGVVKLTPDQFTKILEVNKKYYSIFEKYRATGEHMDDKTKVSLLSDKNEKLKTILTTEQWKKANRAGAVQ
jgi:hypothetical protein